MSHSLPTVRVESRNMSKSAGFMRALKCRECGREYPLEATHVCEFDFGPLEVVYDYDKIKKSMTKAALAIASLASMEPVMPFVSTRPIDSLMVVMY